MPLPVFAHLGYVDVEPAHAGMPVGREIEVAIGTESRELLVARCVDGFAHVLHAAETGTCQAHAPDVESALASRHVGHEVEPLPVGRNGRMRIAGKRVAGKLHLLRLAPGSITPAGSDNRGIAWIGRVGDTLGEIHLTLVGRETTGSLVVVRVQSAGHRFGLAPFPLVVFLRHEDIASLSARDAAQFVARRLVAGGSEIKLVILVAEEHRRIVCPA